MLHNKSLLELFLQPLRSEMLPAVWYSPLTMCLCLMRNFSPLPTHPSFIFLYLHPTVPPSPLIQMSPANWRYTFPRSCWSVYPNVPLCPRSAIAGTPTRWEWNALRRGNICDSEMKCCVCFLFFVFFTGEASPANVTLRDEEEVNKHNGSFSLWDPKTVTQGNKRKKNTTQNNPGSETVHSIWRVAVYFTL